MLALTLLCGTLVSGAKRVGRRPCVVCGYADMSDASGYTLTFVAFSGDRFLARLWVKSDWSEGSDCALSVSQPAGLRHRQGHGRPEPIPGRHGKHLQFLQ